MLKVVWPEIFFGVPSTKPGTNLYYLKQMYCTLSMSFPLLSSLSPHIKLASFVLLDSSLLLLNFHVNCMYIYTYICINIYRHKTQDTWRKESTWYLSESDLVYLLWLSPVVSPFLQRTHLHSSCLKWFHHVHSPDFLYAFLCWWTSTLALQFSPCERVCHKPWCGMWESLR